MKIAVLILFTLGSWAIQASWHLEQMEVDRAHFISTGSPDVRVAIIGSGLSDPKLLEKVAVDEQGNPLIFNAADPGEPTSDPTKIGFDQAAPIADATFGVAPSTSLIVVKVFGDNGGSSTKIVAEGFDYALNNSADIIYFPGGPLIPARLDNSAICASLARAERDGVLVVIPAGNNGQDLKSSCQVNSFSNILVVTATNREQTLGQFSNWGATKVHLAAPGVDVPTPDGRLVSGTMASSASVAGIAALVWGHHRDYNHLQVKTAIINGVEKRSDLEGRVVSGGIANAYHALTADSE